MYDSGSRDHAVKGVAREVVGESGGCGRNRRGKRHNCNALLYLFQHFVQISMDFHPLAEHTKRQLVKRDGGDGQTLIISPRLFDRLNSLF